MGKVRIAVVGAGASGLASARRLEEAAETFTYDVFEQSENVGGTWVYDERTDSDDYGYPIHSSMYQNLRTNLPKEVMAFPDFPIQDSSRSYVPASVILAYLQDYAKHFNVINRIQLNTRVLSISRKGNGWNLVSRHMPSGSEKSASYDGIMVCNGHYHTGNIPDIPGMATFTGLKLHSHQYRTPLAFRGQKVLIIGAGPSGLDIALDVSAYASQVCVSHHLPDAIGTEFPKNVIFKPDVREISENSVSFVDQSVIQCGVILFCTGYLYKFPFLSADSGITVEENRVKPLYKHLISINNPTLCFVGLPFYVCANAMFDLQARFFIASLNGTFKLPSQSEMLKDEETDWVKRKNLGLGNRQSHQMGPLQGQYYEDLATTAGIQGIDPVMTKLHNESSRRFLEDLLNFRSDRYVIVDSENYQQIE